MRNALQVLRDNIDRGKANIVIDPEFILGDEDIRELNSLGYCVVDLRNIIEGLMQEVLKSQKPCERRGATPLILVSRRDVGNSNYMRKRANIIELSGEHFDFSEILRMLRECNDYNCWIGLAKKIAEIKVKIKERTIRKQLNTLLERHVDPKFQEFILHKFGDIITHGEITVKDVINYLQRQDKSLLIVLDGMAIDDWFAVANLFKYRQKFIFALIPTLTSVSRPSLVSGALPREHDGKSENTVFREHVQSGVLHRDTDTLLRDLKERNSGLLVYISRYPDELMHVEQDSKVFMYERFRKYAKEELAEIISISRYYHWKVFISADHGNIECWDTSSKRLPEYINRDGSRCLIIPSKQSIDAELREKVVIITKSTFGYLPENKMYALPKDRMAFTRDKFVVTHGSITPEEVIVPLIEVEGVRR